MHLVLTVTKGNMVNRMVLAAVIAVKCMGLLAGELTDRFVEEARRLYKTEAWQAYTNSLTGKGPFRIAKSPTRADIGSGLVRWVDVEGTCNVRDIGGWTGLRTGLVYRGAEPNCHTNVEYLAKRKKKCHNLMATEKGLRVFSEELGIKTDLDLRGARESPTPDVTPIPGARLMRIPCGNYTNFLRNTEVAAKLLRVFADRANYPVYFHCYGGADRTGSLAFLVEGLCGVPEVDLAIDYELTSFSRIGRRPRFNKPYYYAAMVAAMKTRPGATLKEKVEHYVTRECGLTDAEVEAIRSILCPPSTPSQTFRIRCDRSSARYRCGEPAVFSVESALSNGVAHVRLDNFGEHVIDEFDVDLSVQQAFDVKGSLDIPGFLRLTVSCGRHKALWGAAFSPEKISAGADKPADFESFWRGAIEEYDRRVPEDVRIERIDALSTNGYDLFELSLSSPHGERLYGLLSEPHDLSRGPFPVRVFVPGAGPSDGMPLCIDNGIALKINVHRYRPVPGAAKKSEVHVALQRREDSELASRHPAKLSHYYLSGIADGREAYFYYDVFLAARRAVQWLRRRPEAKKDGFVYHGGSQGGGVGLALVALDGGFRKALFAVPALTAHLCHRIDGRMAGWPRLVECQLDANVAAAERNAPYFDGVNFATMIRCPVRFVVGYVDVVAPPHAGYAAYNVCPADEKEMVDCVGLGHATSPEVRADGIRWLNR